MGFAHPQSEPIESYVKFAADADLLFHDAEYTAEEYARKTGWGHSSIPAVLDLASRACVKRLGMIHLNQDRTDDEMDAIEQDCRKVLGKKAQANNTQAIDCFGVPYNYEITL